MNEEEKNAIEYIKIVIRLVERLQKENEELKDFKKQVTDIESTNFIKYKNYIAIQKIKDKIKELEEMKVDGEVFTTSVDFAILILQELIEEREKN